MALQTVSTRDLRVRRVKCSAISTPMMLCCQTALIRVAASFRSFPQADLIYGHGYVVDAGGQRLRRFRSDRFSLRRSACGNSIIMQQAAFWRRKVFEQAGGFEMPPTVFPGTANSGSILRWRKSAFSGPMNTGPAFVLMSNPSPSNSMAGRNSVRSGASNAGCSRRPWASRARLGGCIAALATRWKKWLVDPSTFVISLESGDCSSRRSKF